VYVRIVNVTEQKVLLCVRTDSDCKGTEGLLCVRRESDCKGTEGLLCVRRESDCKGTEASVVCTYE